MALDFVKLDTANIDEYEQKAQDFFVKEISALLQKAKDLCYYKGIDLFNKKIDGYYIEFKFTRIKLKCSECGRELE